MCDVTHFTLTHRTTCLYLICYALDDAGNVIKVKCFQICVRRAGRPAPRGRVACAASTVHSSRQRPAAQLSPSRPHCRLHYMIPHARSLSIALDVNRSTLAAGHLALLRDLPVLALAGVLLRNALMCALLVLALLCGS